MVLVKTVYLYDTFVYYNKEDGSEAEEINRKFKNESQVY